MLLDFRLNKCKPEYDLYMTETVWMDKQFDMQ